MKKNNYFICQAEEPEEEPGHKKHKKTSTEALVEARRKVFNKSMPEADFETFSVKHRGRLYKFCVYLSGSKALSQDLVQETFLKTHNNLCRDWTLLQAIAYHSFIDGKRLCDGRKKILETAQNQICEQLGWGESSKSYSEARQEHMEEKAVELLHSDFALPCLNSEEQALLRQRFIKNFSLKQISEFTDTPVSTLSSRLHSAILKIRKYLESLDSDAFTGFCPGW